jgi:arylsulfatase
MKKIYSISVASVSILSSVAADTESKKTNIIYILADDLGYRELGCFGQKKIKTPNIDKLAAEGVKLTNHYSGQAVCGPSRCSFLTGKHMGHAYIRNNKRCNPSGQAPIASSEFTIAEMLKQNGYATACVGKWGLGPVGSEGDPNTQGFDLFFGYNCQRRAHQYYRNYLIKNDKKVFYPDNKDISGPNYSADEMRKEVLNFVRKNKDKPFFLYWGTPIPHVSLQVPEEDLKEYLGKWPETPYRGNYKPGVNGGESRGYTGHKTPRAAYAAMISHMDRNVGELMKLLDELKIADNTLLIFTSDNGTTYTGGVDYKFFNSVGKLKGLKGKLYEGGIRVPFIARWPGKIKPGTTSDLISAFWDMMPTFAEVAGIEPPKGIDGISILPALTGKKQKKHKFLYWEFPAKIYKGQVAVRMGDWKGIRTHLFKNKNAPIKLYNLKDDIGEKKNVASEHPEVVAEIAKIMKQEHVNSKIFTFPAIDK